MDQKIARALVSDVLAANAAVKALYDHVDALSPIVVTVSSEETWSSKTTAVGTEISVAPTAHAAESLFHELLHAELKLSGFRQHLTFVRINDDSSIPSLAGALDNELQHHRMFAKFIATGFDPAHFYHDGDDRTYDQVRAELKKMDPKRSSASDYFLKYLSAISPGGSGSDTKRRQLQGFFRAKVPRAKMDLVDTAAAKLLAWCASGEIDAGAVVRDIIKALCDCEGWWIGASTTFPSDGHFVGKPFSLADAERFAGMR
jgi:hypothetical protein